MAGALAGATPSVVVELGLVAVVVAVYLLAPGSGGGSVDPSRWAAAEANADALVELHRRVGLLWEPAIQRWALGVPGLVVLANVVYCTLHFLVTPAVLVWLHRRRRGRYTLWRNTLAFASLAAFATYRLWPLAPPRLAGGPGGSALLQDTLATDRTLWSFDSTLIAASADPLAAMPSMHAGWALACGWAVATTARRPLIRLLAWSYPTLVTVVIVVTGNHYLADAVAGMAVVVVARALAGALRRLVPSVDQGSAPLPLAAGRSALDRDVGSNPASPTGVAA